MSAAIRDEAEVIHIHAAPPRPMLLGSQASNKEKEENRQARMHELQRQAEEQRMERRQRQQIHSQQEHQYLVGASFVSVANLIFCMTLFAYSPEYTSEELAVFGVGKAGLSILFLCDMLLRWRYEYGQGRLDIAMIFCAVVAAMMHYITVSMEGASSMEVTNAIYFLSLFKLVMDFRRVCTCFHGDVEVEHPRERIGKLPPGYRRWLHTQNRAPELETIAEEGDERAPQARAIS
eukprot:TRINITY_DN2176_c0_g1_i1.p1 TRINITY_DN2176_c0_g1~~TRINITY_DN2176_c0_g1_i1.p1  ORF type:complete len:234 (+),score=61.12 TRINITY_DN2176_c0_g1_i1:102-803(+)